MKALIILILLLASCAREQPGIYITDREMSNVVERETVYGLPLYGTELRLKVDSTEGWASYKFYYFKTTRYEFPTH